MNRDFIFRIENLAKKEKLYASSLKEKDGGLVADFTYNVTAQIVQAQTKQEMMTVCMAIEEYLKKNNIDICYAINEDMLNDLLHNHEQLYKRLYSAEEQNKRVLDKLDIITRSNQELEQKLDKTSTELIQAENLVSYLESENRQLRRDLKMFKSVNEFINNYGIEKAREVLLQSEKTMIQKQNSKAIEVLGELRQQLFGNPYNGKHEYMVGEIIDKIDIQIRKLGGGENENLCQ